MDVVAPAESRAQVESGRKRMTRRDEPALTELAMPDKNTPKSTDAKTTKPSPSPTKQQQPVVRDLPPRKDPQGGASGHNPKRSDY